MTAARCVVALDVGGTSMKGAVVDRDGVIRHQGRASTPHDVPVGAALQLIAEHLRSMFDTAGALDLHVAGVCVAVPGIVDETRGIARHAANLGWHDVPVADELSARLDREVLVTHDVRAGGLAESRAGASAGVSDSLFVAVGTGVSAALIVDGSLVLAGGKAGEIGHVRVPGESTACVCGDTGCLETVASAMAIARAYRELGGTPVAGAAQVADRVRTGDPIAAAVWGRAVHALGDVLAPCLAVLGSQLLVVGGGLSRAGALLLDPLTDRITTTTGAGAAGPPPRVVAAALGDAAGCLGAAMLA
ncbi:MAG: ROK family protein, partial [Actinomycetes bacterium]